MGFFFHCALVHLYHRYAQNVEEIFALEDLSVHTQLGLFKMLASTPKHTVLSNFERKSNRMIKKKNLSYLDCQLPLKGYPTNQLSFSRKFW